MSAFFNTLIFLMALFFGATVLHAEEYSSASFIVRDPVTSIEGGRSTSPSFEYYSSTGQTIIGENTTPSFMSRAGFLYFSTEVIPPPPPPTPPPPPPLPVSGGGGNGYAATNTGVNFSGRAYPGSLVFLLKDGQMAASTIAGGDANFRINLTGLSSGSFIFTIYAEDQVGRRSTLFSFPVTLTIGATTDINGIFIAPTIATDKIEVRKGDNITILGQSVPNADISIAVHSDPEIFVKAYSDKYGGYLYNLDTSILAMDNHSTKSKASVTGDISQFGRSVAFKVGTKTVFAALPAAGTGNKVCDGRVDLNNDCRVNLIDYSILAFWYKKVSPPEKVDLNNDGKINIVDFSIMAYYWTI